jgi:hypothetical protein
VSTPPNSLPSKQQLLSFQDSWMRPAGIAALAGAFVTAGAVVLQQVGLNLPDSKSDADQLAFVHAHSGRLILSSVLQAVGFLFFLAPLVFLFRSASGRAERMRNAFLGLIIVGPIAFGGYLIASSVAGSSTSDRFVAQEPAVVQQARQHAQQQSTATGDKATAKAGTTSATTTGTTTAAAAQPRTPDQAADAAREDLADDLNKDSTGLKIAGFLQLVAILALVFGLIYTSLWSMRTGLLSRFWGMLGIAFGLFLILPIFPAVPGIVLWFAALGLMFIGVWPRPLPPAWAAGEAVPWPRPGEDIGPPPEQGPVGTVEGSGREISEQSLPEDGGPVGEREGPQPPGETQGQRRRKRKRRK